MTREFVACVVQLIWSSKFQLFKQFKLSIQWQVVVNVINQISNDIKLIERTANVLFPASEPSSSGTFPSHHTKALISYPVLNTTN